MNHSVTLVLTVNFVSPIPEQPAKYTAHRPSVCLKSVIVLNPIHPIAPV